MKKHSEYNGKLQTELSRVTGGLPKPKKVKKAKVTVAAPSKHPCSIHNHVPFNRRTCGKIVCEDSFVSACITSELWYSCIMSVLKTTYYCPFCNTVMTCTANNIVRHCKAGTARS